MKLPEELKREACRLGMVTESEIYENLVRDCAKVCSDGLLVADVRVGSEQFAQAILARYGLEPKP